MGRSRENISTEIIMKEEFLAQIAEVFEVEIGEINLDTKFKEHDNWSSLTSLTLFAMLDDVYSINISDEELQQMNTLEEIFSLING